MNEDPQIMRRAIIAALVAILAMVVLRSGVFG